MLLCVTLLEVVLCSMKIASDKRQASKKRLHKDWNFSELSSVVEQRKEGQATESHSSQTQKSVCESFHFMDRWCEQVSVDIKTKQNQTQKPWRPKSPNHMPTHRTLSRPPAEKDAVTHSLTDLWIIHLTSCSDLATPQDEKCNRGEKKGKPEHVYILNALANKAALYFDSHIWKRVKEFKRHTFWMHSARRAKGQWSTTDVING